MDDYISRQAAIDSLGERPMSWTDSDYEIAQRNQYDADLLAIETVPPADVVEVVRCKDCKYAEVADKEDTQDGYTCQFHRGSIWFSGSYCSWAERRNDGWLHQ